MVTSASRSIRSLDRGEIILINLNPTVGKEMQGEARPALVVSSKAFNDRGIAMVCPISTGEATAARNGAFFVSLMGYGLKTLGGVVANQSRTIDWQGRIVKKLEKAPQHLVQQVQDIITAIVNDE